MNTLGKLFDLMSKQLGGRIFVEISLTSFIPKHMGIKCIREKCLLKLGGSSVSLPAV